MADYFDEPYCWMCGQPHRVVDCEGYDDYLDGLDTLEANEEDVRRKGEL